MDVTEFQEILAPMTAAVAGQTIDGDLRQSLEQKFPPGGEALQNVEAACLAAIEAGWMCAQGDAGRRFGRVIKPSEATGHLSVDVVELENIVGPHHRHPSGEVCLIMPQTPEARFDGEPAGWCVFEAGSAHHPTVSDGRALVLYFLPNGEIEFTGQ